jgi:signal transduction histidine kinase
MTRPSILLVDDVEENLVALEALLGDVDCDLVRAKSGNEGLRQLLKREFAVMLLDVQMPNMDGYEMAHYARENPETRQVPIIFLTAMNQTEDNLLQGYGSGAVDILYKPFSPMILRSKVRVFLELYNTRRKLADGLAAHQKTLVELKASRDELEQRHRALEQAQRDHRELTEFIVHDLKNPLSIAYAGLDWASEQIPPSQGDLGQALADSREATMRLRSMIEDLLTISRMEQADFPLQREILSVARFLRSVVQGYAQRAQQHDIVLVPPTDVVVEVVADQRLLRRVVENILDNAFRYTPAKGRIAVSVRPSDSVEINVSNDGPVIPPPERHRIFEKFKRGAGERVVAGNAGLGLYFCKRAVEAHGGEIDVVSTQDWATSFRISLPAMQAR